MRQFFDKIVPIRKCRHLLFPCRLLLFVFFSLITFLSAAAAPLHLYTSELITVKGHVTDASGEVLSNVTVQAKRSGVSAVTDADGNFSISVEDNDILVFSFVGYTSQEEPVKGKTTIDIALIPNKKQLDEVVVTALGIRKERRALGYSVTEVAGASLTQARENNLMNGLEGKVAGVNVSNVATGPGGSANVVIRGVSSITGSSQPLYVIDGVPITNTTHINTDPNGYGGSDNGDNIGNINPDDIESISILKGAAASALYGYRGSKGVILITTKSAKRGQGLGVELNSNYVLQSVQDNTDWQTEYGQGYSGLKPINQADARSSNLSSWGAKLDGSSVVQFDGVSRPYSAVTGNIRRFYRTGINGTNTVSFSKGFQDGGIRFSASNLDDQSIIPNSGLKRQSFNLNTNFQLDKHLKLDLKANYITQQIKNSPQISDAVANSNFATLFLPPNVDIKTLAPGYNPAGDELLFSDDIYTTNPYFAANKFINNVKRNSFIGMANLVYTFDNGLFVQGRVGQDYFLDRTINITPTGTAYFTQGSLADNTYKSSEINVDGLIGKNFKISKDFAINATAGTTYRRSSVESVSINASDFAIPYLYTPNNGKSLSTSYATPLIVNKSLYAAADLSYKTYLYVNLTGRNDWYSTLAPGKKISYFYPSVNASFVFSELVHVSNMDYGKFRIGYADVGGEADEAFQTFLNYNVVTTNNGYPIGNIVNSTVPNSQLTPSSAKEFEVGTELSFFQSRLKFDVAAYQKKITKSIINASTSETSGYTSALLNIGSLQNRGIEMLITGVPVRQKTFSWTVTFNASYNKNKVLKLASDVDNLLLANSREGEDDGTQPYIAQIAGMDASQIVGLDPARDKDGKIIIDPATGAPDPGMATYKPFGSGIHPWGGGITNEFSFKNFHVSFLVDAKFGGKIFSGTNYVGYQLGLSKETLGGRDKQYGDGSSGSYLAPSDYYYLLSIVNSRFIYDASFIKLRQVIIGYTIPAKSFHNKIQGIGVSIVARNPLVLMKHTPNIDPESNYTNGNAQGLELASVPYTRTLGLNINVKF